MSEARSEAVKHLKALIESGEDPVHLFHKLTVTDASAYRGRDFTFVEDVVIPMWDALALRTRDTYSAIDDIERERKDVAEQIAQARREHGLHERAAEYLAAIWQECQEKAERHGDASPIIDSFEQPDVGDTSEARWSVAPGASLKPFVTLPPEAREQWGLPRDEGEYPASFRFKVYFDAGDAWQDGIAKVRKRGLSEARRCERALSNVPVLEFRLALLDYALAVHKDVGFVQSWREMHPIEEPEEEWESLEDLPLNEEEQDKQRKKSSSGAHWARHMVNMLYVVRERDEVKDSEARGRILIIFREPFSDRQFRNHVKELPLPNLTEAEKTKYWKFYERFWK